MSGRTILSTAFVLAINLGAVDASFAQSNVWVNPPAYADAEVTVLAIAPDGTWGVATERFTNRAIANAIADCKGKYQREIGCGYQFTSVHAGWSLAIRCGDENIIVAARTLVEAEQAAVNREFELRQRYVPDMPACVRVLSVDPYGRVVAPNVAELLRTVAQRSAVLRAEFVGSPR
jgi:hypothetical protein